MSTEITHNGGAVSEDAPVTDQVAAGVMSSLLKVVNRVDWIGQALALDPLPDLQLVDDVAWVAQVLEVQTRKLHDAFAVGLWAVRDPDEVSPKWNVPGRPERRVAVRLDARDSYRWLRHEPDEMWGFDHVRQCQVKLQRTECELQGCRCDATLIEVREGKA
jgi:hypothetical protein